VASGTTEASAVRDYTVKVDAAGLRPGRIYHYAFDAAGERSAIGRTKTLPQDDVARVRLASISCANYPAGYFNVYRCVAGRSDLDAVVHLGDYVYEFANGVYGDGSGSGRVPMPAGEASTLADYRMRYATYRSDVDLQAAHAAHPFIAVWDDHEVINDWWRGGAAGHRSGSGDWATRLAAGLQAYREWMPVRETGSGTFHLYRDFRFGRLADLTMLDTRSFRDRQVPGRDAAALADPSRTLMGAAQEEWFFSRLQQSQRAGTAWRLIGQQTMFSPLSPPGVPPQNTDVWDGYPAARARVFDAIERTGCRTWPSSPATFTAPGPSTSHAVRCGATPEAPVPGRWLSSSSRRQSARRRSSPARRRATRRPCCSSWHRTSSSSRATIVATYCST